MYASCFLIVLAAMEGFPAIGTALSPSRRGTVRPCELASLDEVVRFTQLNF